MKHPFEFLSPKRLRGLFWLFLGATLALLAVESLLGAPLQKCRTSTGTACDIVSFELAGTEARSGAIVSAWNAGGVMHFAKWNTWLDYIFMACYPNCVALGIVILLGFPLPAAWRGAGRALAWAQWLVWASDALENVGLLKILHGAAQTPWPEMAFGCAVVKFTFFGAGLAYLFIAFVYTRRMRKPR